MARCRASKGVWVWVCAHSCGNREELLRWEGARRGGTT